MRPPSFGVYTGEQAGIPVAIGASKVSCAWEHQRHNLAGSGFRINSAPLAYAKRTLLQMGKCASLVL